MNLNGEVGIDLLKLQRCPGNEKLFLIKICSLKWGYSI